MLMAYPEKFEQKIIIAIHFFNTKMHVLDLEKMAESTSAHGINFSGLGTLRSPPTEKQLYEIELARLAARQVTQRTVGDSRAFKLFRELSRMLREYKGVSLPSFLGPEYAITVKPRY